MLHERMKCVEDRLRSANMEDPAEAGAQLTWLSASYKCRRIENSTVCRVDKIHQSILYCFKERTLLSARKAWMYKKTCDPDEVSP